MSEPSTRICPMCWAITSNYTGHIVWHGELITIIARLAKDEFPPDLTEALDQLREQLGGTTSADQ